MPETNVRVSFQPWGRTVFVLAGTKIIEAAARAGLTLSTPCGSAGTCGKCQVRLSQDAPEATEADQAVFSADQLDQGWRLACQTAIQADTVVHVPEGSRLAGQHQIVTESQTAESTKLLPGVRKVYVELPEPSLADNQSDRQRMEGALGRFECDLPLLRELPQKLRDNSFQGTAVLTDRCLLDFEAGDTSAQCYGVAFDIGTTTMAASLLDLHQGRELAVTSQLNAQVSMGDDVLSRIKHASSGTQGLEELSQCVKGVMGEMIADLCAQADIAAQHIYELSIAGNTTMQHLLCAIDPSPLGEMPFVPAHARGLMLPASTLGIPINARGMVHVFPAIGGFVGGDTVAGILATDLSEQAGPVLMIDIGTNGEIVLAKDGAFWAASTAAGPAFEGARISCGMRATSGAVEKVVFDEELRYNVIGNVPAQGICGSALIDLAAELLRLGMVTSTGQLLGPNELPASLPAAFKQRIVQGENGPAEFVIAPADSAHSGMPVTLTQRDIRELQLAVGAIRAGITIMLKQAGIAVQDLERVLIAGGFGSFIRRANAQRIGLLPTDIEHHRINYVGNTSLAGAKWALLSTSARQHAEALARKTRHLELSLNTDFQMEFAEAMIFPES
jgi:uncharacterized 2Fe-2S/4Fe-4S cluster protein (DUF4445 family)